MDVTREQIDRAVAKRDIHQLTLFIITVDDPNVRKYLAITIQGILNGEIKFPRGRPKKGRDIFGEFFDQQHVAELVWLLKKVHGWKKTGAAVKRVAEIKGCSERHVWTCWKKRDLVLFNLKQEKREYDAMVEGAYEARWEAAKQSLAEHFGADRDFTDEEIEQRAEDRDDDACRDFMENGYDDDLCK
jgi:excinuclease UvrABC nuclease subunit